jgi:hypothetical protein
LTVIVVSFFESIVRDHSKDHPMAVVYISDTLTGIRTPLCRTQLTAVGRPHRPRVSVDRWLRDFRDKISATASKERRYGNTCL